VVDVAGPEKLLTSPLNRIPSGLLDFFRIKSMGQYPQRLGDTVLPIMDLFRFYADDQATEVFFSGAQIVADTGTTTFSITSTSPVDITTGGVLLVPNGEIWIVLEGSVSWNMTTTGTADFGLVGLGQPNGLAWLFPMSLTGFTQGVVGAARGGRRALDRPMFMRPGTQLAVYCAGVTIAGGTTDWTVRFRLLRLAI
jgi:hypothetical protein